MISRTQLITRMAVLVALGFSLSFFLVIPIFGSRVFPAQHLVGVIAAVTVGPWYGMLVGLMIALLRIGAGTATILAIPGSIFGVLVGGLLYRATRSRLAVMAGEVFGTGVVGALAAWPVAVFLQGSTVAAAGGVTYFVSSWTASSLAGAIMGGAVLSVLEGVLPELRAARAEKG